MTENKPQDSCVTKIKKWGINFYTAPCFWLKTIPLSVLFGLAAIGLYQIVTSAFHYFSTPLSYFDPERLGQLGDFLGGTLNPIFGFVTVCLLLWSVFIQRKELSLTRKELTKSATALNNQVRLATDEYNRKQINESLSKLYETLGTLHSHHISPPQPFDYVRGELKSQSIFTCLRDVSVLPTNEKTGALIQIDGIREKIEIYQDVNLFDINTLPKLLATIHMVLENISALTQETIKLTQVKSIRKASHLEIQREIEKFREIKVISNQQAINFMIPINSLI
ncbi:hypothetical protein [Cellvibrio sp. UBA7671]|uniref:hypothetical protein n=1 Tax=Cellvibrio sp. UBA7671 TaxID=1946312 RepID=UPI002F3527D9